MNLFICFTPLQLTLAEKIIEQSRIDKSKCYLFYYSYHNGRKDNYYFERHEASYNKSYFYNSKMSIMFLLKLRALSKELGRLDTIYLASVDNNIVHFFISNLHFKKIKTFDDGTANITKNSVFFVQQREGVVKKIRNFLLGKKYDLKKICNMTCEHYTIYPEYENITHRLTPLLFLQVKNRSAENLSRSTIVSLFIGSVYPEIVARNDYVSPLENKLISLLKNIDCIYLPHPRDTTILNVQKVSSDMRIVEEIVLEFMQDGYLINVYGFSSSSQFNLINLPGVTCFVIDSIMLNTVFRKLNTMAVSKGARLLNID